MFLLGTLLSANAQVPNYVPSNGLVGWWPFSGNANDQSGNGNNGTVNGAKLTTDRFGLSNKSYNFDGKTNFIEIPSASSLNLNGDFTISSWFNSDTMYDVPGTVKMILSKNRNGITTNGYAYGIWNNNQSNAKRGMINFSGAPKFTTEAYPKDSSGDVRVNKWYHYVVTYNLNANLLNYYLNGVLIDTKTINYAISSNTLSAIIGAEWMISGTGKKNFFNGKLDDIGIWNKVLTSDEIINLFTSSSNGCLGSYIPQNGLIGWWPFCGNANDESGNGNNGTVNGANLITDRNGNVNKAYNFDGKTNFIEIPSASSLNLNGDFTISSWFNSDTMYDVPGTVKMILSKNRNGITTNGYAYGIWNNKYSSVKRGMINYSGAPKFTTETYPKDSSGDVKINLWYNYTVSYKLASKELRYYINGTLVDTQMLSFNISTNNLSIIIGGEWQISGSGKKNFFNGKIDDIGIWNRQLTSPEVAGLYAGCPLNISNEPSNQGVTINGKVQFNVLVNDSTANYQWQTNTANIGWNNLFNNNTYSGVTSKKLTVSNVQVNSHKQLFRVIATKNTCKDTSVVAMLTVNDTCITNVYDTIVTSTRDTLYIKVNTSSLSNPVYNTVKVYPNPSSTQVIIDNGNYSTMGTYTAKIVNTAGQQVFQSVINQQQFVIDAKTMGGAGVYTLYITDANNKVVGVKKIVLQ